MKNVRIGGTPLSRYQLLPEKGSPVAAFVAQRLHAWLKDRGTVLCMAEASAQPPYAIFIGKGTRKTECAYGEYQIYPQNGWIFLDACDVAGLTAAAARLISALSAAPTGEIAPAALFCSGGLQKREDYAADGAAFCATYAKAYQVSDARLTLEEKRNALQDPKGRTFVIAHRGEHIFYPENSLEGALSAWRCGVDAVEVDIQKSVDGAWVCMHDSDLTRMTNAADLLGKAGYPTSPLLCDWSLAQLRTLRLKDAFGALTPFVIPTLQEILRACDGRIYVHLDKAFSVTEEIFPVMEELGVYQCVYLVNHIGVHEVLQHNRHFASRGVRLDNLTRPRRGVTAEDVVEVMLQSKGKLTPAVIPFGDYIGHGERERELIRRYGDRIRFGAWFLRDFDHEALWQRARAEGISIFMTDHPMDVIALFP